MLIEALSEFVKQVGEKTYKVLSDNDRERPNEPVGIMPPDVPSNMDLSIDEIHLIDSSEVNTCKGTEDNV